MLYIYELSLNTNTVLRSFEDEDAVFTMIVVAENDVKARELAIKREWEGEVPGQNRSTADFWGPHIQMQIQYVTCTLLGTSVLKESKIICTRERHTY